MKRFNTYDQFLNEGIDPLNLLTQEQVDWCNKHIKQKWGVNSKGEVTVRKDLLFKDKSFDRFPVQFAPVKGDFNCSDCRELVSLEGAPREVKGNFNCGGCKSLDSLEDAPQWVGGRFECDSCTSLKTLKGGPLNVGRDFSCRWCYFLTSLEGAPESVGWEFDCRNIIKLETLKGVPLHLKRFLYSGCPKLPHWETDLVIDHEEGRMTWEEVHSKLHKESYRRAAQTGLI